MKKRILSTLLLSTALIGTSLNVNAQWRVGARGGLSIPSLSSGSNNPLSEGYSSRMTGQVGVFGEYQFSKLFSIQAGLEYSGQGGKKDGVQAFPADPIMNNVANAAAGPAATGVVTQLSALLPAAMVPTQTVVATDLADALKSFGTEQQYLYADAKSTAKFEYLMLPITAKFGANLTKTSPVRIYVGVGPFLSYCLSAHRITDFQSNTWSAASGAALPAAWQSSNTGIQMQVAMQQAAAQGMAGMATAAKLGAEYAAISGINAQTGAATGASSILGGMITQDNDQNIYDDIKKFNFGITANIGFSYSFGLDRRHAIFIEGGGNYGFIKLQKDDKNGNNNIGAGTVMLGYSLRLGR